MSLVTVVADAANCFKIESILIYFTGRCRKDNPDRAGILRSKIAYLGSDSSLTFAADRKTGYQMALTKHGIPFRPEYCAEVLNVSGDNTEAISSLLLQDEPPTAIVVSDDILAVSLERVCLQNHVSIPDDLSIISFNNSLFARSTSPQLTSIDINSKQLGIEAASQMINHIENPNLVATKIIVPHQLIERDSCCKVK